MALSRSESVRSSVSYDARSDLTELTENDFAFLKQSGELNSGQDILHQSPPLPSSSTFCPPDFMPSQSFFTLGSRNRGDSGKPTSTSSSQQYESGGSTVTGSASKIAKMASKHEQVVADIKEYYISEIEDLGQIIAQQKNTILGLQERTGGLEAQGGFSARDEKQIQDLLAANQVCEYHTSYFSSFFNLLLFFRSFAESSRPMTGQKLLSTDIALASSVYSSSKLSCKKCGMSA